MTKMAFGSSGGLINQWLPLEIDTRVSLINTVSSPMKVLRYTIYILYCQLCNIHYDGLHY